MDGALIVSIASIADFFTETTALSPTSPFDDALSDLRVSGCVVLHETYGPPWAIDIPAEAELRSLLRAEPGVRIVPFHFVRRGEFELSLGGSQPLSVRQWDVAICPGGISHRMRQGHGAEAIRLGALLTERGRGCEREMAEGTELICGVFFLRAAPLNPLFAALPSVLKVPTAATDANPILARTAELLALDVQHRGTSTGSFTASRLLEIFCAEILRAYQQETAISAAGWLSGLSDPKIAKAVALIHSEPAAPWTIDRLAAAVALSPSRFAARFRDKAGETAMAYVTRWRMVRACRLLESSDASVEAIASQIGYSAASSFSRVFKNALGVSPAEWRKTAAHRA